MNITKLGQCCLLIEIKSVRVLTDPGRFSVTQNDVKNIDIILITHEHTDHFHTDSLQIILANNPQAIVVTNTSVGKVLNELNIPHTILEGTAQCEKCGITLEAYDGEHVEIFETFGKVQNTGYMIEHTLFYPGDAYTEPGKDVDVLALPVAGPWCSSADAIAYALRIKPKKAFPVHDWLLNADGIALTYGLFESQLQSRGIDFVRLYTNETKML